MQILRFAVVGTIGFIADTVVLLGLATGLGIPPLPSRIASFVSAASLTYWLNLRFTFQYSAASSTQWLRYLLTTGIGALINIGAFYAWVSTVGASSAQLVLGAAIGSLLALFFNYFVSRTLVFRARRQ